MMRIVITSIKSPLILSSAIPQLPWIFLTLWALHNQVKAAGVIIPSEIGQDPGIDPLYAVKTTEMRFTMRNSDNPLGYKFSWSPRSRLLALLNPAQWYLDGNLVTVEGFNLVGYANRDTVGFLGVLPYPRSQVCFPWYPAIRRIPEIIRALIAIGYFTQLAPQLLRLPQSTSEALLQEIVAQRVASLLSGEERDRILTNLRWVRLFTVQLNNSPQDGLQPWREGHDYPAERFYIGNAEGSKETRSSTLVGYGEPSASGSLSAMAKLVGLPCAVRVLAVLEGRIEEKGMVAPWTSPEIAASLREALETCFGIKLKESVFG
ncbi:uncharacterized protein BDW43DRAFT_303237 [Aspergillus alliaceus]|uniref:uncharacterized protein n=1 Tax=Petromyces alliaceus TaxID=209559 RepID=UPI0012A6A8FD|nr:uncharacterized protein BDW43DRAFT_303237 [Aspergillus alliaceus]KAB8229311.1 hypothetical protein BDW43DRAFT_303237 [Aspergillus alliaceus]